jgi:hypothetical protein
LKKRTKKLLLVSGITRADCLASALRATDKSFLFLFFKKEILPSSPIGQSPRILLLPFSAGDADHPVAPPTNA